MTLLAAAVQFLFTDAPDVRDVPAGLGRGPAAGVVVGLVQAEVLPVLERVGALDHDRLDRGRQQLGVVPVGAFDREPERAAASLDDQALLRAGLASVGRVGALFSPPKRALPMQPSAACQRQSTAPNSSHSLSSVAHNPSNTPSSTKRWNQRCTVASSPKRSGSRFHWQPERIRKMTPLTTRRRSTRGRPVAAGG